VARRARFQRSFRPSSRPWRQLISRRLSRRHIQRRNRVLRQLRALQ
jgi:hypothetical protein